jgi:hypothetical protein
MKIFKRIRNSYQKYCCSCNYFVKTYKYKEEKEYNIRGNIYKAPYIKRICKDCMNEVSYGRDKDKNIKSLEKAMRYGAVTKR